MPELGEVKRVRRTDRPCNEIFIWFECPQCKQRRWLRRSCIKSPTFTGLCHSCSSKNKIPPDAIRKGPEHGSWRGGRHYRSQGDYILIWVSPDDFFYPMAKRHTRKDGRGYGNYIYEHRLIMAKHLSRCLLPWEIVHHRNGVKDDNRNRNLIICTVSYHKQLHDRMAKFYQEKILAPVI